MRYLMGILSCGRPQYLSRVLEAYADLLTPAPAEAYCFDDGGQLDLEAVWPNAWKDVPRTLESHPSLLGRCAAHANLWKAAAASDLDYAWTVEDDILLLRPLNLRDMAALLEAEPNLAQVALVRCPWGGEVPFSGFIPMREAQGGGWYERRTTSAISGCRPHEWIASTLDWTSSPALLRTSLPREVAWPAEPGCEGTLGPAIQARYPDAVSGYYGHGECWVGHIGMERAEGAWGY